MTTSNVEIGGEGNETLQEIITRFTELTGDWNGDTPTGEDRAMAAQDIVDTANSLKSQIENFNF